MAVRPQRALFRRVLCVTASVLLLAAAGCQGARKAAAPAHPAAAKMAAKVTPVTLDPRLAVTVVPANAARAVRPERPVIVTATAGTLAGIRVASGNGSAVPGRVIANGARWISTGRLAYGTTYTVTGQALDAHHLAKAISSTFSTLQPVALSYPSALPQSGQTVGVGMPIIVYWSRRVPDRAAAERLLKVTSDKPVEGAWHWVSDTEVRYRPRVFWPAYSHVRVDINAGGAPLGGGVYGEASRHIAFTVGSSVVSRIDNATKSMTVYQDGKPIRTMPVSLGRASMPTSAGIMVVFIKYAEKYFDSASFGIPRDSPDGYYTKVYWDTKFTFGGEYVHAAPWSIADQGHRNVSHGCVNVSPANAQWFYYLSKPGDIVQVIGTERAVRPGDGYTDWNVSWAAWRAGSALH